MHKRRCSERPGTRTCTVSFFLENKAQHPSQEDRAPGPLQTIIHSLVHNRKLQTCEETEERNATCSQEERR